MLPSEAKAKTERTVGLRLASLHGVFGNAWLFCGFAAKYAFAYSPPRRPFGASNPRCALLRKARGFEPHPHFAPMGLDAEENVAFQGSLNC